VRKCLAKDADERWQSVQDLGTELKWSLQGTAGVAASVVPAIGRKTMWLGATLLLALVVLGAFVAQSRISRTASPAAAPIRLSFSRPDGTTLTSTGRQVIAISPDGRTVVFTANGRLYARKLDASDASPIVATQKNLQTPIFSPDGRWIAFFSEGRLQKVPADGGAALPICDVEGPNFGASWAGEDEIFFATPKGVFRVAATGGAPQKLIDVNAGETAYGPQMLPDGDHVLLSVTTGTGMNRWDEAQIVAHSLSSRTRKMLIAGGADGRYLETGHIVYARGTTLFAVPFTAKSLQITGPPQTIERGVRRVGVPAQNTGAAFFAVARNGNMTYIPDAPSALRQGLINVGGRFDPLPFADGRLARISPDGAEAVVVHLNDQTLWVYSLVSGAAPRQLTRQGLSRNPIWTADGKRITYRSTNSEGPGIFSRQADGSGEVDRLLQVDGTPVSWSRDGTRLFYISNRQLWSWQRDKDPQALLAVGSADASLSPDAQWVAFHEIENGKTVPYIQPLANAGLRFSISRDGGSFPLWAPDGKRLFYVEAGSSRLMTVTVQTKNSVTFGQPAVVISEIEQPLTSAGRNYDVTPDGTRLLVQVPDPTGRESQEIVVVVNWLQELRRLIPTN
jgi:eukaryotic-like serine/threonine-protein kinase